MSSIFDYQFNVGGNFTAAMDGMAESTGRFNAAVETSTKGLSKWEQKLAAFGLITDYMERLDRTVQQFSSSGIALDSQMHDLSAVAGVVGEDLKKIEGYARESAKAFGTDAAVAVEGYKLLLGQLTPELAKCPEALKAMGESVQVTSKLMGNDGVAAAEVLTTAMNQYGVSLDDPMEASRKMAEMMNVMAAAGQEGSAELPAQKVALEQCGMAAKAANVAFEETAAAIQVLDKAGKKGSEGGVALRNTLAILGQGRFLPKQTQEELAAAGIDINKLADTSLSLKERLDMLKPVMTDAALFSKLFGMENANAARALVQGSDELGRLTTAITGTSSAEAQAINVNNELNETVQTENNLKVKYYINSIIDNIYSFKECFPIGKLGSMCNFVQTDLKLNENTGVGLNCLELPSNLTLLNFIENKNLFNQGEEITRLENGVSAPIIKTDLFRKIENATNIPHKDNRIERNKIEISKNETKQNYQEITKEDIEEIVYKMFEREVELCLF